MLLLHIQCQGKSYKINFCHILALNARALHVRLGRSPCSPILDMCALSLAAVATPRWAAIMPQPLGCNRCSHCLCSCFCYLCDEDSKPRWEAIMPQPSGCNRCSHRLCDEDCSVFSSSGSNGAGLWPGSLASWKKSSDLWGERHLPSFLHRQACSSHCNFENRGTAILSIFALTVISQVGSMNIFMAMRSDCGTTKLVTPSLKCGTVGWHQLHLMY